MNHIYKVVLCKTTGIFKAVPEFAKGHAKSSKSNTKSPSTKMFKRLAITSGFLATSGVSTFLATSGFLATSLVAQSAYACPNDTRVSVDNVTGVATITHHKGYYTNNGGDHNDYCTTRQDGLYTLYSKAGVDAQLQTIKEQMPTLDSVSSQITTQVKQQTDKQTDAINSAISKQTATIAQQDIDISGKADITYVDSKNLAQDGNIKIGRAHV